MKKVISMVLAILMSLSLAACGGKEPDKVRDEYPGTWELDHVVIGGAEFTLSELEALGEDGSQIRMVLKEGGKAYASEGSYGDIVDWSETESGILLGDVQLIMEDGLLRMESDDDLWYFRKVSDSQLIEKPTEPGITNGNGSTGKRGYRADCTRGRFFRRCRAG